MWYQQLVLIQMPPYLWGSGIWEVQLVRGSMRCLGFYQGFDSQKNSQAPALHLFPQHLCSGHCLHWLPCFGFCMKLRFQTEIWNQSLHGQVEVRNLNGYRPSSEEQRFVMNVNMQLICIFWIKLFRQKKAKFCLFFRLKKSPVSWKTYGISQSVKIPVRKQPNFKIFKKAKFLTLLLSTLLWI